MGEDEGDGLRGPTAFPGALALVPAGDSGVGQGSPDPRTSSARTALPCPALRCASSPGGRSARSAQIADRRAEPGAAGQEPAAPHPGLPAQRPGDAGCCARPGQAPEQVGRAPLRGRPAAPAAPRPAPPRTHSQLLALAEKAARTMSSSERRKHGGLILRPRRRCAPVPSRGAARGCRCRRPSATVSRAGVQRRGAGRGRGQGAGTPPGRARAAPAPAPCCGAPPRTPRPGAAERAWARGARGRAGQGGQGMLRLCRSDPAPGKSSESHPPWLQGEGQRNPPGRDGTGEQSTRASQDRALAGCVCCLLGFRARRGLGAL